MFILKPNSGVPIYRQLSEQIRRMVAGGQLAPGDALPSIREMALKHTINPMTVSKVYSMLEAEGVLERNRGKPMTVAAREKVQIPSATRMKSLDSQLDSLALAGKQLELNINDVIEALKKKWEEE